MRKFSLMILAIVGMAILASCSDTETYADQKKKENSAIRSYISKENIKVISEEEFFANDSTTDVDKNEYVLFESSGVYMQIVRKGCGKKLTDGETATVLCRFTERNLLTDSLQLSNDILAYSAIVDKMSVKNTSGSFTASFDTSSSMMYSAYGSASVPSGWLVPLTYVNVGRPSSSTDEIAKVKIIVPHTQGHQYASSNVYPCFYDITYQRGR